MKIIIFNDKENSDRTLNRLNLKRDVDNKRFFKIRLLHNYLYEVVCSILKDRSSNFELIKSLIYTGEYNPVAINNVKKSCGGKIRELNVLIKKEELLLEKIKNIAGHDEVKQEIIEHVDFVKQVFEKQRNSNINAIKQQCKNAEGQAKLFENIKNRMLFTELRTTPLVTRQGYITQKGVDSMISTDLILLAQSNAFDIAILLTGDTDLKESIKLIREKYGKLVIIVAYRSPLPEENKYNTINEELVKACDYFLNFYDLPDEGIEKISVLKEDK